MVATVIFVLLQVPPPVPNDIVAQVPVHIVDGPSMEQTPHHELTVTTVVVAQPVGSV